MISLKSLTFLAMLGLVSSLSNVGSRRAFVAKSAAVLGGTFLATQEAQAAPQIFTTNDGKIKYATIKDAREKPTSQAGDIVAVEYTGYLTDGTIFDATHAEGKKSILMFQIGGNAVVPGVSEMVQEMGVGQKVQAIIPPELAFGDKGLCLESGECLIKPGSTLVYDIYLKRTSIPPP
eukprot:CAMPEP_0198140532 /NCGR_PEP_ID=MMETSP1443-20131203/3675_1 /TAXON_ID=186043 /ORGANISM="Entomoneis sp., Strain CCMP2396" /LENGTH=176 /DNA_ID=CAMNT_0043802981 /DNA_START=68 /DNA_END=598 /DNA_ORIENTATION=+